MDRSVIASIRAKNETDMMCFFLLLFALKTRTLINTKTVLKFTLRDKESTGNTLHKNVQHKQYQNTSEAKKNKNCGITEQRARYNPKKYLQGQGVR
ncbi:unnamed protein product [Ixodes pacificus]